MRSDCREGIVGVLDALDAAVDHVCALSFETLTTPERMNVLARLERVARRLPVPGHRLINQLAAQADREELGAQLPVALATRLHITPGEAGRRIAEAADLGPRRALTGEQLALRRFLVQLPAAVDPGTRAAAEAHLARLAAEHRPDDLAKLAERITAYLNPDGNYTDADRARRRGLTLGKECLDGMSELRGLLTPEARATLEAVLAKLAAPGMCNPDDERPVVDGPADERAVRRDARSAAQRNHDALNAAGRALLASGKLGQHNGLPAAIIVTAELKDLEAAAGTGLTAGGTLLPMSDVIRLTRHAHHYLAIFDKGKALALYHTKRLASPGQRIVLYAKDRGCTRPNCTAPGYWCEVHHVQEWAISRRTDINSLTLACGPDHALIQPGGWTTRTSANGDTEWLPPPHLDHGQPRVNEYHHPEKILGERDDGDP
ncbi:REP13E12 repeat protein [Mycobacterium bohemicum DSM 44277]|uniref:REP13E12 repeat protein n=1 Tax=Mycobacterium bohemicum DSM 44277 TaxID=1236609 RepID=A0A0U0W5L1_MYCBE|nr:HNH endonuclease signature motif containing protein [Mycobacterium bohemicum]CPR05938.1 REP13E12 repeat protein [Mycobacterium bohemicum DSM 44277]